MQSIFLVEIPFQYFANDNVKEISAFSLYQPIPNDITWLYSFFSGKYTASGSQKIKK